MMYLRTDLLHGAEPTDENLKVKRYLRCVVLSTGLEMVVDLQYSHKQLVKNNIVLKNILH